MKKIRFIVICFCAILVSSCSSALHDELTQNPSMVDVFDQFCTFMEERYVFWDIDTTDWSEMYQYRSQFENLDINNQQDLLTAVGLFREMTKDIVDHHFTINFTASGIRGLQINPALDRKQLNEISSYFDSLQEVASSIRDESHVGGYTNGSHFITGFLDDHTVIFKANIFNFRRNYDSGNSPESDESLNWFFKQIDHDLISNVVLDLRSCTGGDLIDLDFFFGRLIVADIKFGYTKFKAGKSRTDYTPLIPAYVRSHRRNKDHAPKITVLTNNMTASLAETIAYIVQSNNLGVIVGSRTYGATSPNSDFDIFNSGSISIGDFMQVRTSSVQFLDLNKRSIEGLGVEPY